MRLSIRTFMIAVTSPRPPVVRANHTQESPLRRTPAVQLFALESLLALLDSASASMRDLVRHVQEKHKSLLRAATLSRSALSHRDSHEKAVRVLHTTLHPPHTLQDSHTPIPLHFPSPSQPSTSRRAASPQSEPNSQRTASSASSLPARASHTLLLAREYS